MLQAILLQASLSIFGATSSDDVHSYSYEVLPGSQISISGKSNVNTFRCYTASIPQKDSFLAFEPEGVNQVSFYHADIDIRVKSLNCGNRLIENDLNKSLNSDRYPFIMLRFKGAKLIGRYANNTFRYQTSVSMTIANTSRNVDVEVTLQKLERNTYRVTGSQIIDMADYNIKQPTAMLGLIVVDRQVTINFNIVVVVYKDILGNDASALMDKFGSFVK